MFSVGAGGICGLGIVGVNMETLDWKKELEHLYQPSTKEVTQVDVPAMNYLMIDGKGDPNTAKDYADAIEV